jgi:anaerobic ribonucleoside-triphosphate reductase activating protein
MLLRINSYLERTKVLGPYDRFALWTQGCIFDCPGCMSRQTHDTESGEMLEVSWLVNKILSVKDIEGITISGGEPFLQIPALVKLIKSIKNARDFGVILYTGYTKAELLTKVDGAKKLLDLCDILIDGRYEEEMNDSVAFRGSSNQVVHLLTSRYQNIYKKYYNSYRREVEIIMGHTGMELVGIPQKKTLEKIRKLTGGEYE